jgi:hypothetical protein
VPLFFWKKIQTLLRERDGSMNRELDRIKARAAKHGPGMSNGMRAALEIYASNIVGQRDRTARPGSFDDLMNRRFFDPSERADTLDNRFPKWGYTIATWMDKLDRWRGRQ